MAETTAYARSAEVSKMYKPKPMTAGQFKKWVMEETESMIHDVEIEAGICTNGGKPELTETLQYWTKEIKVLARERCKHEQRKARKKAKAGGKK